MKTNLARYRKHRLERKRLLELFPMVQRTWLRDGSCNFMALEVACENIAENCPEVEERNMATGDIAGELWKGRTFRTACAEFRMVATATSRLS